MKVFLSWSGTQSRIVAEALYSLLPKIIQAIDPFLSGEIEKGAKWSNEIDAALEGTSFGLICLTKENLAAPWILYEAGALSKTSDAYVWTLLYGVKPSDVQPPLSKFQHTTVEKDDLRKLLHTINRQVAKAGEKALSDGDLDEIFDTFWPKIGVALESAGQVQASLPKRQIRSDRELLQELLELVREQQSDLAGVRRSREPSLFGGTRLPPTQEELEKLEAVLPEQAMKIAALRFGGFGHPPVPNSEVATVLGLSRTTVHNIEREVLTLISDMRRVERHARAGIPKITVPKVGP